MSDVKVRPISLSFLGETYQIVSGMDNIIKDYLSEKQSAQVQYEKDLKQAEVDFTESVLDAAEKAKKRFKELMNE